MKRRDILLGSGGTVLAVLADKAFPLQKEHHAHPPINQGLVTSASNCVTIGEICLNHIHEAVANGDNTLAECARSVNELIAACTALRSLAAQNSSFVPKYAKLTAEVCKSSEAECRKFEKSHTECKACADACAACITECAKVT